MSNDMNQEQPPASYSPGSLTRRRRLIMLFVVVVIAAVGFGIKYYLYNRWFEATADAYASGDIVDVTSQLIGTIVEINVEDNNRVNAGQALLKLGNSDALITLAEAEAHLARTVRQVRGLYANVNAQAADLSVKQAELARAKADFERRKGLEASGAISQEVFAHAAIKVAAAERGLSIAGDQLRVTRALIDGTTVATHPDVKLAAGAVQRAYLDVNRTVVRAPVTGYVTSRRAQLGQRVAAGMPLLALVSLDKLWVDANFKETQLQHMRVGQPVELSSDVYGADVIYHGTVGSLGIGTGSAMSILPAQNATGNWIKIVQRVPVRILLDADELRAHPLRIGLSMQASVNTRDRSGPVLSVSDPTQPTFSTMLVSDELATAELRITDIINNNLGTK